MFFWSFLFIICMAVHHVSGGYHSCKQLRDELGVDEDGIYHLRTSNGMLYQTFCDMTTAGGGWTLVASVHENNVFGKCSVDDRWSSQQLKLEVPAGDGNWQNRNTFGTVEGATSEDFKNPGYYDIDDAQDVAVWHVPNITPACDWKRLANLRYRTISGNFGTLLGGSFYKFFNDNPVAYNKDNSCLPPPHTERIKYDFGTDETIKKLHGPSSVGEFEPGFISFRPTNTEGAAFAICSGVKPKVGKCNVQHYCIGGGGYIPDSPRICGDFAGIDWNGYGSKTGWSASKTLTESSILLFVR